MDDPLISYLQNYHPIHADDRRLILDAFEQKTFQEGDYLFRSGHVCRHRFFICDGVLRIMAANDKGIEITHFFLKTLQFCTILQSFNDGTIAHTSIQAACDTTVRAIGKDSLLTLNKKIPWLKPTIDEITRQALLDKINLANRFHGIDSTKRYRLFLELQPEIAHRVSLAGIASYLDITPQSLSRIRRNIRQ
ncbi:MAG TPA: cyclic nucleotide-binding domain-containing protein [Puia sp.]|nr:cyclic nucleotide-binding domain-containing protein [Puia sp.]